MYWNWPCSALLGSAWKKLGLSHSIVAGCNVRYLLKNQLFVNRSQYIKNPLHKQSEKAFMFF